MDSSLNAAAAGLSLAAGAAVLFGAHLSWPTFIALTAAATLWRVVSCFLAAALAHVTLELFSRPGSAADFLARVARAERSWTLLVPAALIARWALPGSLVCGLAILLAAWLMNSWLRARAVACERGISPWAAVLALFWPGLAAVGLLIAACLVAALATVSRFQAALVP